jgi:lipoprotein-anchoring transpeptidase ErfK/SrfK
VSSRLRWHSSLSLDGSTLKINGTSLPANQTRLINGAVWIQLEALASAGATISADLEKSEFKVSTKRRHFAVITGSKRIEVDLARQRLYAYQGRLTVLDTNISSGRYGNTPAGHFTAGPYKNRMHYSSKYHNAPMPWSVQITGHIFFHGFSSVPNYPASHGCIRVPLTGANPARFLYEWVEVGTPIDISRGRKEEIRRALPAN